MLKSVSMITFRYLTAPQRVRDLCYLKGKLSTTQFIYSKKCDLTERSYKKRNKPEINHVRKKNPEAQETLKDRKGKKSLFESY